MARERLGGRGETFLSLSLILFYYYYYFEERKNEWRSSSKEVADDPGTGVDVKVGSGSV